MRLNQQRAILLEKVQGIRSCAFRAPSIPLTLLVLHSGLHTHKSILSSQDPIVFVRRKLEVPVEFDQLPPWTTHSPLITAYGDPGSCVLDETVEGVTTLSPEFSCEAEPKKSPYGTSLLWHLHLAPSHPTSSFPTYIFLDLAHPSLSNKSLFLHLLLGTQSKTEKSETYVASESLRGLLKPSFQGGRMS